MPTLTARNGAYPMAELAYVESGEFLRPAAADAYLYLRDLAVHTLGEQAYGCLRSGYRSMTDQITVFRQRYTTSYAQSAKFDRRRWNGQTWWRRPNCASAATPGKSWHGEGLAVDVDPPMRAFVREHGPSVGFRIDTVDGEPWHCEHDGVHRHLCSTTTTTTPEGDWLDMATPEQITAAMTAAIKAARPVDWVLFTHNGVPYEHNVAEGWYRPIVAPGFPDAATRRENVLETAGYKVTHWGEVKCLRAMGVEVEA